MTLAASWGALAPDFGEVVGDLQALPTVAPFETLAARLPSTPELWASRLRADTIGARRRLAAAEAEPNIDVSLGVRRLEAFKDHGVVMSISSRRMRSSSAVGTGIWPRLAECAGRRTDAAGLEAATWPAISLPKRWRTPANAWFTEGAESSWGRSSTQLATWRGWISLRAVTQTQEHHSGKSTAARL